MIGVLITTPASDAGRNKIHTLNCLSRAIGTAIHILETTPSISWTRAVLYGAANRHGSVVDGELPQASLQGQSQRHLAPTSEVRQGQP
jgi:hypothetical protein